MTVALISTIKRFVGLDADNKPEGTDIPIGSRFLEADDAAEFIYIGTEYHAEGLLEMADAGEAADTIAIGDTTYTLVASDPEAGDIVVGASAAATAANIVAAINGSDEVNSADPAVSAELSGADVRVVALEHGDAANSIGTVYTADDASANAFSAATLAGGFASWQALP